jgi:hypothetical protein
MYKRTGASVITTSPECGASAGDAAYFVPLVLVRYSTIIAASFEVIGAL